MGAGVIRARVMKDVMWSCTSANGAESRCSGRNEIYFIVRGVMVIVVLKRKFCERHESQ